jgi:septal ring factor EnvC (AmiA/AmiB activator)
MSTKDQLTQHASQIARFEQAMTALAEAQVKTEDDAHELRQAMIALAKAQTRTEASLTDLARQFQAY